MISPAAPTTGGWHTIEELFHDSLEVPSGERGEFLRRRCPDETVRAAVAKLLEGHSLVEAEFILPPEPPASAPLCAPQRIGRYRIVRLLGSGGMGAVYEAEQTSPNRIVALKVLRAGLSSPSLARRFEHEAQVLALLRHPGIAQVYDAGAFDDGSGPIPWFAMEYVSGARPITEFAAGLSLGQRLELFLQVCDAVHYGHTRGVIHRDLKPANILIDGAGRPKVIDFGIARTAGGEAWGGAESMHTRAGQIVGTVAYMSPELCGGGDPRQFDTRGDVYSLGVVLFELLCGRTPFDVKDLPLLEALRAVREQSPPRPGGIDRALRGDLETILLTAIDRDPARRYQSVADLAADIRRSLADRPITARPATAIYQLRKFARRNRAAAIGAAIALAGLVAGAGAVTWQAFRLAQQRDDARAAQARARDEADTANRIAACLQTAITSFDPRKGSTGENSPAALLHASAQVIVSELGNKPMAQAEFFGRLGSVYINMGLPERARPLLASAVQVLTDADPPHHRRAADMTLLLGHACRFSGDRTEAERLYRLILAADPADHDPGTRVGASMTLAGLLTARADYPEAQRVARAAIVDAERAGSLAARVNSRLYLVAALDRGGQPEAARAQLKDATALAAPDPVLSALALATLASFEARHGNAEAAARAAAGAIDSWFTDPPPPAAHHAQVGRDIGMALAEGDLRAGAERFYRDALRRYTELAGPHHVDVANLNSVIAGYLVVTDRPAEAVPYFRQAIETLRVAVGSEHPEVGACLFHLARIAAASRDLPALRDLRAEALELDRVASTLPPEHPHRSGTLLLRGLIDMSLGDLGTAEPALRECVRQRLFQLGQENRITAYAQTVLGACLTRMGGAHLEEAGAILRESVPRVEAKYLKGSVMTADALAAWAEYEAAAARVAAEPPPR